jgi:hypothetical protein
MRPMRFIACAALLASAAIAPLAAQVGHRPAASPYRDVTDGHSVTPMVGYLAGGGGRFGIGGHNGTTYGFRYDMRTGKTVQFGFGYAQGNLDRFIVNPFVRKENRLTGPFDQLTRLADVSVQVNLAGGKSWHGLAPYTGVSLGVAFGRDLAADTSGYSVGTNFYFAPQLGTRFFLGSHLHLRAEVRAAFWKLNYPDRFGQEPVEEPGTTEEPNAVITDSQFDEWTSSPWLQIGLGYAFRF